MLSGIVVENHLTHRSKDYSLVASKIFHDQIRLQGENRNLKNIAVSFGGWYGFLLYNSVDYIKPERDLVTISFAPEIIKLWAIILRMHWCAMSSSFCIFDRS